MICKMDYMSLQISNDRFYYIINSKFSEYYFYFFLQKLVQFTHNWKIVRSILETNLYLEDKKYV